MISVRRGCVTGGGASPLTHVRVPSLVQCALSVREESGTMVSD